MRGQPGGAAREQGPPHPALAAPGQAQEHLGCSGQTPGEAQRRIESTQSQAKHTPWLMPGEAGYPVMRCLQTPGATPTQRLLVTGHLCNHVLGAVPLALPQAPSAPSAKSQRSPLSQLLQEQCAALCGSNAPQCPADSGLLRWGFMLPDHSHSQPQRLPPSPPALHQNLPLAPRGGGQPLQHLPTERMGVLMMPWSPEQEQSAWLGQEGRLGPRLELLVLFPPASAGLCFAEASHSLLTTHLQADVWYLCCV